MLQWLYASELMFLVLSNSWLAAVDRMARSLGLAPITLKLKSSCRMGHAAVLVQCQLRQTLYAIQLMCLVPLNSWLAAIDRIARSLGLAPITLDLSLAAVCIMQQS